MVFDKIIDNLNFYWELIYERTQKYTMESKSIFCDSNEIFWCSVVPVFQILLFFKSKAVQIRALTCSFLVQKIMNVESISKSTLTTESMKSKLSNGKFLFSCFQNSILEFNIYIPN